MTLALATLAREEVVDADGERATDRVSVGAEE
jgi:hypothetical protein